MRFYKGYGYQRIIYERLSEPLHLNIASVFVKLFGSFSAKVAFDVTERRSYAYGILETAWIAKRRGLKSVTVAEFGVASGGGLLAMCRFAEQATALTGVRFNIVGFDGGTGLPPPVDYRDHPDLWLTGDYQMPDRQNLLRLLPPNARIIFGPIAHTARDFINCLSPEAPLGFVSIDVDYYSSAKDCLEAFRHRDPARYLPITIVYFDDIYDRSVCAWTGELLAIREFNDSEPMRKLEVDRFLRARRLFKNASWIDQIYLLHVLDHPVMQSGERRTINIQLANKHLGIERLDPTSNFQDWQCLCNEADSKGSTGEKVCAP